MPFDLASAVGQTQTASPSASGAKGKGAGAGFADLLDQVMGDQAPGQPGAKPKGFIGKLATAAASIQDGTAASAGLAALQGITPGFLTQPGQAQPPADLAAATDALTRAQGSGADPAALKAQAGALLDRLNKAEARLTGVDPTAAPESWTEPQAFAQTRAALTALINGGAPASASAPVVGSASTTAQTLAALNTADGAAQGAPTNPAVPAATAQAAQSQAGVAGAAAAQAASPANAAAAAQIMPATPQVATPGQVAPLAPAGTAASAKSAVAKTDAAPASTPAAPSASASAAPKAPGATGDQVVTEAAAQAARDPGGDKPADPASDSIKTADAPAGPDQASNPAQAAPAAVAYQQGADVNVAAAQAAVRGSPEATAYLAAQLVKRLDGQSTRFEMQLHPADLGRVDVQMRIEQDGRLNAQMAFDNPVAAADFRAHADELRRQLEQAGFQLSDNSLSFTDRNPQQQGQSFSQSFAQSQQDWSSGQGSSSGGSLASLSSVPTEPVAAASAITSTGQTQLGLDLKV